MKKLFLGLILLLSVTPLAMAQEQIVIDGTGDSQQLLRELAQAFETANPGTRVVVPDSVGSSGGVRALLKGNCDLARTARPLKEKEKAKAADLVERVFAKSPVVFVANLPDKCVSDLTTAQITGIFSGTITSWAAIGSCQEQPLYVANREEGDSSRSVLGKKIPQFKAIEQFAGKTIYSTPETVATLSQTAYAFGYMPKAAASGGLTIFAYNGVAPSEANVQNGAYQLVSPYSLIWRGELQGLAQRFVDFVASPAGQQVIRAGGAVPVADQ